jgi:hypothetical protein
VNLAAGSVVWGTNGIERARIDVAGNLGIGTSSPVGTLDVVSPSSSLGMNLRGRSADDIGTLSFYTNNGATNLAQIQMRPSDNEFRFLVGGARSQTFYTNGSERARIDSSGNFTLDPSGNGSAYLRLNTSSGGDGHILLQRGGSNRWQISSGPGNALQFYNYTAGSESMRIDSSGNLLVGGTTQTNAAKVESLFNAVIHVGFVANDTSSTAGAQFFIASNNGSNIGSIQRVGATSAVVYNTTSDQRLKSNITDSNSVLPTLMEVRVRQFDWTEGEVHQDYGFIAQELEATLSGVVTKGKTEEDMWQMDYARLTPHLVKAIQEQQALITALTARITALESI